jgi:crotonobetainyl-CoA:carnitine CoA-transferase CaiB-like acyl-CoA transferase
MILDFPHPQFGTVKTVAGPIKISDTKIKHRRGPNLGEHTDNVLQTLLDLPPAKIESYRQTGLL